MPLVLMVTIAAAAAAGALAVQTAMERPIAAAQARALVLRARAEDAMTVIVGALAATPAWSSVPGIGVASPTLVPLSQLTVGARGVAVAPLTTRLNAQLAAQWSRGAGTPQWRFVGARAEPLTGVLAWVADDAGDPDGSALSDTNDRLLVRVHAFGAAGGEVAIQALVARVSGATRVLTWREVW